MVKNFKAFNESNEDIHSICKKYNITNYTINDDGTIDVNGSVELSHRKLTKIPLKFRNVSGYFYCGYNELITLEGGPQSVGGGFYCNNNQLITLEGAPQSVDGCFNCNNNKLITLEGAPQSVDGCFYCSYNKLITLKGAPQSVRGNFSCSDNQLKSLEYISNFNGTLYCGNNPINKWWSQIDTRNDQDVEAFLDFNIHTDDPDEINQEKIDQINNG